MLWCWSAYYLVPSGWTGLVELEQRINFKWRGLPVATMNFSASIPFVGERGVPDEAEGDASKPAVLIELMGQTKGPLRLFEDYQATVRYLQIDAQGSIMRSRYLGWTTEILNDGT